MDFTLSLTHFCETHGPKSVLCTQILPLACAVCLPPSPPLRARTSGETLDGNEDHNEQYTGRQHTTSSLRKTGTDLTLPTDFSNASTQVEPEPESPNIERHPLFKHNDTDISPQFRYGRAQGETCASCSFSAPETVADRLPSGAPGSLRADGKSKNGAPVFRSRELVCLGASPPSANVSNNTNLDSLGTASNSNSSAANSYPGSSSYTSTNNSNNHHHPDSCHDHTLTYLTAKSPSDPETYASLRASVIRTLSCELLPRGMSDGPLCFGDSFAGYTIAYVFRLTDPKARGRRRCYAFLALAGKDASRAFRACPMLWEAFASMAKGIEGAATRAVEEKERKEEGLRREREEQRASSRTNNGSAFNRTTGPSTSSTSGGKASEKVSYTPVSSFLTQRAMDPDGNMRRAGQTSPRSLADIVGDETIFAILHQYFVALLRCLGDRFGGLPITSNSAIYQTMADAGGLEANRPPTRVHEEPVASARKTEAKIIKAEMEKLPPEATAHIMPTTSSSLDEITVQRVRTRDSDQPRQSSAIQARAVGKVPSPDQTQTEPPHKPQTTSQHTSQHSQPAAKQPKPSQTHNHRASIASTDTELDRAKRRLSKTLSLGSNSGIVGGGHVVHGSQCAPSTLQLTQTEVRGQVAPPTTSAGGGGGGGVSGVSVGAGVAARERVVA